MDEFNEDEIPRTVEVAGLPQDATEEDIYGFFENKRFGGGEIVKLEIGKKGDKTYITFKNEAVIGTLLKKHEEKRSRICGVEVDVSRYERPEPVPVIGRTIVVSGISEDFSEDDILCVFENARKGGGTAETFKRESDGNATITFAEQSVAERWVSHGEATFSGKKLTVVWPTVLQTKSKAPPPVVICPRTVIIDNVSGEIYETLELSLESKRNGGGKVESIERKSSDIVAVTFVDEKVAETFLKKGKIKVGGKELHISKPTVGEADHSSSNQSTLQVPNTIEVSGIPQTTSEDYLRMYFENVKRSGGGDIKRLSYDQQEGIATITFTDTKAVTRILQRESHTMASTAIIVIALESLSDDLIDQVCAVRVSNIPTNMSTDLLQLYFDNEKKSGGTDIEDFSYEKDDNTAIIVYKSPEVVKRVLQRSHTLDSVSLTLEALKPGPPPPVIIGEVDEKKLLVSDLPSDYSRDKLKSFLETSSEYPVSQFHNGQHSDLILVEFKATPNYEKLRKLVVAKPFQGQMISVQKVKPTSCILIHGAKSLSDDIITLHLENPKRGCGGEVKNIRREDDDVIIEFQDRAVIPNVLKKKQVIEGHQLKTELYHDCLSGIQGSTVRRPKIQIPNDATVKIEKKLLDFILKSTKTKSKIESELQSSHCSINWQTSADSAIELSCTLTPGMKNLAKLAAKWEATCSEQLSALLEQFVVKTEKISNEIWDDFVKNIKPPSKKEEISVEYNKINYTFCLVGADAPVAKQLNILTEIRNKLMEELAKRKSKTYESFKTLKPSQLHFLKIIGFPKGQDKLDKKDIEISVNDSEITFQGTQEDINQAKIVMFEVVNNINTVRSGAVEPQKLKFLQRNRTAYDFFKKEFERRNLKVAWHIDGNELEVYGLDKNEMSEVISLFQAMIDCKNITLDVTQLPTVKQQTWIDCKKSLENKYEVIEIVVKNDASLISCISTHDVIDQIVDEIEVFLQQHTIVEQFIGMEDGHVAYIERFRVKEMEILEEELKHEGIKIEPMQKKQSSGIIVRGTRTGLAIAVKRLSDIQRAIISYSHESEIYGIQKYFSSKHGKNAMDKIHEEKKVIIEIHRQLGSSKMLSDKNGADAWKTGATLKSTVVVNKSMIEVLKGNIAECQLDCLVISTTTELKHTDGVAKAISDAGGQDIDDECQACIKSKGKLLDGQVYASKSGLLKCSGIIHMAIPPWKGGTNKESDYLAEAIFNSLTLAESKGWTFVAISGASSFPAVTVALTIVEVVEEFLRTKSEKYRIQLIDANDKIVNHFHETLISKFGKNMVNLNDQNSSVVASPKPLGTIADQRPPIQTSYTQGKDSNILQTPEGVSVSLIQGQIASQQVDVIFNTVSKDLNLTQGAVSKSILDVAGPGLQAECKQKKPNGIQHGEILVTTGGNLTANANCKNVYHGACAQWDGGAGNSQQILCDLLSNTFKTAHQNNMTSIAVPALGTGNLGTPRDVACQVMYEEAEKFSKSFPGTKLIDIRFVVFDQPTVDAFKEHLKLLVQPTVYNPISTLGKTAKLARQLKRLSPEPSSSNKEELKKNEISANVAGLDLNDDVSLDISSKVIKIGKLVMEVRQGDITKETTDAIVNSTNKDLNLSGGAVSQAIVKAGGDSIAHECKKIGKTKHGIAVTNAGNLQCKHIIHLATPDAGISGSPPDPKQWVDRITECLKKAEDMKLNTIAFPLLGTGKWNTSPGEMADNLLSSVGEFSINSKPKHLRLVRVTIFQTRMVDEFFDAVRKRLEERKSKGGILGAIANWWSSWTGTDTSKTFEILDDTQQLLQNFRYIFRIYGTSQSVIDAVITELEGLAKEAVIDRVLDTPNQQAAIRKLTDEQIKRLENDAARRQVRATVEKGHKINRIRLQGEANDITDVIQDVFIILQEVEREQHRKEEAERITQQAHWEFQESDGTFESYPPDINVIIEKAYQSKCPEAIWEENSGTFKINFKSNTEEEISTTTTTNVRRIGDAPIEEPKHWEPMSISEPMKRVHVPVGSKEFMEIEEKVKATCRESCKEIIKVERIQNHKLYQQYAVLKLHMDATSDPNTVVERVLWHGTSEETVAQVNTHGFNRSYCGKNATYYGQGVYFAKEWAYSAQDTYSPKNAQGQKFIYQARVLTGEFTKGDPSMIDVPVKQGSTTDRYDSLVENVANPTIFVVLRDAQAYPEYLITFI